LKINVECEGAILYEGSIKTLWKSLTSIKFESTNLPHILTSNISL